MLKIKNCLILSAVIAFNCLMASQTNQPQANTTLNYTATELQQKKALYSNALESISNVTKVDITAQQLTNSVDTDELYNKKAIKEFIDSVNLSAINTIQQASSLIVQASKLVNSQISVQELTSILNLCNSIIDAIPTIYQYQSNSVYTQTFKADDMLISIAKIWEIPNLNIEQIKMTFDMQDKLYHYILTNNISFSEDVPQVLTDMLAQLTMNTPELLKVHDKENTLIGWLLQNVKDIYLSNSDDLKDFKPQKWLKWKKILQSDIKPVAKNSYKVPKGKFMFEVWTPQNEQQKRNLIAQLDFIKSKGYIGVVVVWDGESDYNKLIQIQKLIKDKGFKIWLAFSTQKKDELKKHTFVEPEYYAEGLKALAKNSQAFLMGWRRTSIHLNQQNEQWQNYTMNALRQGNPDIGFIGEAYLGYNGTHPSHETRLHVNYRQNYNAILAMNFGFVSVNPMWAIRKLKATIGSNTQYICVIQGIKALYLKDYPGKRKRTKAQYHRINNMLQRRFLKAGFNAVIGLSGDGLNRDGAQDDMCLSKNHVSSNVKF